MLECLLVYVVTAPASTKHVSRVSRVLLRHIRIYGSTCSILPYSAGLKTVCLPLLIFTCDRNGVYTIPQTYCHLQYFSLSNVRQRVCSRLFAFDQLKLHACSTGWKIQFVLHSRCKPFMRMPVVDIRFGKLRHVCQERKADSLASL